MTERVAVSIVVPVRDEADRITACVAAHQWAAEIVVVDDGSVDATAALAVAAGARVIRSRGTTIGDARNTGADAAVHEWILALDADEIADATLGHELAAIIGSPAPLLAYRLRRANIIMGRVQRHGPFARDWVTRFYHRSLRWNARPVHEALITSGTVGSLHGELHHAPYRNLEDHLARLDRYARLGARALHEEGRHASWADCYLRPAWRFVRAALVRGGVLDGRTGLLLARLDARSAYLKYRYLKQLGAGS